MCVCRRNIHSWSCYVYMHMVVFYVTNRKHHTHTFTQIHNTIYYSPNVFSLMKVICWRQIMSMFVQESVRVFNSVCVTWGPVTLNLWWECVKNPTDTTLTDETAHKWMRAQSMKWILHSCQVVIVRKSYAPYCFGVYSRVFQMEIIKGYEDMKVWF